MYGDAVLFSPYRYNLTRSWEKNKPKMLFVMLHPSTATADEDDHATRRCIQFAKKQGFGSLEIVNLFAYIAIAIEDIKIFKGDRIGGRNQQYVLEALERANHIVLAWGNQILKLPGENEIVSLLEAKNLKYYSFGLTAKKQPRNPLALAENQKMYPTVILKSKGQYYCRIQ